MSLFERNRRPDQPGLQRCGSPNDASPTSAVASNALAQRTDRSERQAPAMPAIRRPCSSLKPARGDSTGAPLGEFLLLILMAAPPLIGGLQVRSGVHPQGRLPRRLSRAPACMSIPRSPPDSQSSRRASFVQVRTYAATAYRATKITGDVTRPVDISTNSG
jgi:hypothetical protein